MRKIREYDRWNNAPSGVVPLSIVLSLLEEESENISLKTSTAPYLLTSHYVQAWVQQWGVPGLDEKKPRRKPCRSIYRQEIQENVSLWNTKIGFLNSVPTSQQ
jgi:hypothetical protein